MLSNCFEAMLPNIPSIEKWSLVYDLKIIFVSNKQQLWGKFLQFGDCCCCICLKCSKAFL
jgi:hypothetical protein